MQGYANIIQSDEVSTEERIPTDKKKHHTVAQVSRSLGADVQRCSGLFGLGRKEAYMAEQNYEAATKRLISVLQRLEQWFRGEKLYQKAIVLPEDDIEYTFQWNYLSGHIEWLDIEKMRWSRVINAKRPDVMCQCVMIVQKLHEAARQIKSSTAKKVEQAAQIGECYLSELSEDADLSGPL